MMLNYKNEIFDHKDELYDCRNESKQNMIVLKDNECEYITTIGAVYLISILPLRHFEPDLNTHNSKPDLHTYYLPKFQKSRGKQSFD